MTWFRVDDGLPQHPKLELLEGDPALHASAVALWTLTGADSMARLTDGVVTHARVARLLSFWPAKMRDRACEALVRIGLWEPIEGGYVFHDWHDCQPSVESIKREREASRKRVADWKAKRRTGGDGNGEGNAPGNGVPTPVATPEDNGAATAFGTGPPSRPVPSRRDPEEISSASARSGHARTPAAAAEVAWARVIGERGGSYAPDPSTDGPRFKSIAALLEARRGPVAFDEEALASARAHMATRTSGRGTPRSWLEWLQREASAGGSRPINGASAPHEFVSSLGKDPPS